LGFRQEIEDRGDPELKQLASKTLPKIERIICSKP
jgi:hypothetical protein